MRVLHWYPNFQGGGGVTNSVLALANAQAAMGTDVWIVSVSHDRPLYGALALGSGVQASTWVGRITIGRGGVRLHSMDKATRRRLQTVKPDVVHVHGEFNPDNWWAPRLFRCPVVLSPHGAFHPAVLARGALGKSLYVAAAQRALYRRLARVHALSPSEVGDISAVLPNAQVYCLPQGTSPGVAEALDACPRGGANGQLVKLLFVGRIDVEVKGLDTLVEALALAMRGSSLRRPTRLLLVGPDWKGGKGRLLDLARQLGIEHSIEILDAVMSAEIPAIVQSADIYIQLSRNEGNPLSLNDALAFGKPAIVSDRIGTASYDMVREQPHVRIVPPTRTQAAEAIAEVVTSLDAFTRAGEEARTGLRDFLSWDRIARLHLLEYESLSA